MIPGASAQEPYPFFHRADAVLGSEPKVGVDLEPDRSEASAGDDFRYWIKMKSLYTGELPPWKIAFFFDATQMQILSLDGGRLEDDHVIWNVPTLQAGEERTYSVRVHLFKKLQPGEIVRTYASMIWDGQISPACDKHELTVIGKPPVTGPGDYTAPVEDLTQFLRPVHNAAPSKSFWVSWLG